MRVMRLLRAKSTTAVFIWTNSSGTRSTAGSAGPCSPASCSARGGSFSWNRYGAWVAARSKRSRSMKNPPRPEHTTVSASRRRVRWYGDAFMARSLNRWSSLSSFASGGRWRRRTWRERRRRSAWGAASSHAARGWERMTVTPRRSPPRTLRRDWTEVMRSANSGALLPTTPNTAYSTPAVVLAAARQRSTCRASGCSSPPSV
mmetsp:Transcript_23317/g.55530  ORF Transcript_23317/g.55530 Transcript_23317/m.55530 type:complete len:203 (+) Transcript_23317:1178-1786(+)